MQAKAERKEYKRIALLVALIWLLAAVIALLLFSFTYDLPPYKEEEFVMDFSSGGGSSGGGSPNTETTQNTSSMDQPEDPIETSDPESPITKPTTPTTDGNSNSNDNSSDSESQKPANDFGNLFGGNGGPGGNDDGNTGGSGGGNGPNIGSGTGSMGSGRDLLSKPATVNPIQETGNVRVKIFVKRNGTVDKTRTKVLHDDPKTTSPHKAHWDKARELANKFKFEPVTSGHKLEYITITIKFTSS